jgi:excisionase family DNA binding protein
MSLTVWEDELGSAMKKFVTELLDAFKQQTRAVLVQQLGSAIRVEKKNDDGNKNLSVDEAAKIALKKPATIRDWIKDKRLKATKPKGSRQYLIAREDLDRCLSGDQVAVVDVKSLAASILRKKGK